MENYEIKEFYGEDLIPYLKLSSIMFRQKNEKLKDCDEYKKILIAEDKKHGADFFRLGAYYNDKLYAAIESYDYEVYFDGNLCKMSGIGGVISDFNSPIRGGMKMIYKKAFEMMHERGQYISHLYAFEENYYRQYGYDISCQSATWDIPIEKITYLKEGSVIPYDGSDEMKSDIIKIYEDFSLDKNMLTKNTEKDWSEFFNSITPFVSDKLSFIHYDCHGNADAYMNYTTSPQANKPQSAVIGTMWFSNLLGLRDILSYFKTQKSYCDNLIITLPENIDISPIVDSTGGWGMRNTKRTVINQGTTRIVDVEKILEMASYKGEGKVCIKIYDDTYAPWNNDCFTVKFGSNTIVTRGGSPDIEMKINSFSAAILGRVDLYTLTLFPDVKILNDKNLEKIFYKKNLYIEKHF